MHKNITWNGRQYELQITAREIINDGRTAVLLSDSETEQLVYEIEDGPVSKTHRENTLVELDSSDYELIMDALNALSEARESEIKWAGDDMDIVEADQDCIDSIEALQKKLREA